MTQFTENSEDVSNYFLLFFYDSKQSVAARNLLNFFKSAEKCAEMSFQRWY